MSAKKLFSILGNDCDCPSGYIETIPGICELTEVQPAIVTQTNYCLAPSTLINYSNFKSRIYNSGFNNNSIEMNSAPAGDIIAEMNSAPQWRATSASNGPMNRAGVWIDSDCDGIKNGLVVGQEVTLAYAYTHTGAPKTIYVGVGADNQFTLIVNNVTIAKTLNPGSSNNFGIWHIFPIQLVTGTNYFNLVAVGDGSTNDSFAMTIYNNTALELQAATDESQLNVLFTSSSLIGQFIDVATCPTGYNLDTTKGQGNYVCVRTFTTLCE